MVVFSGFFYGFLGFFGGFLWFPSFFLFEGFSIRFVMVFLHSVIIVSVFLIFF